MLNNVFAVFIGMNGDTRFSTPIERFILEICFLNWGRKSKFSSTSIPRYGVDAVWSNGSEFMFKSILGLLIYLRFCWLHITMEVVFATFRLSLLELSQSYTRAKSAWMWNLTFVYVWRAIVERSIVGIHISFGMIKTWRQILYIYYK